MLRDYQEGAISLIRKEFDAGNEKVLLVMPTGAGKTVVFCEMVKAAVDRDLTACIIVRGRKLVDQASKRLFREGVHHGVLMANHWNKRPHARVQVCSVDTLKSQNLKPKADLVIVDEAHLFTSDADKEYLKQFDCYSVAVTATPYTPKGLRHLADTIVRPISMQALIDQGHLVPFRYFAPSTPDLSDVKVSATTKDYVNDQLEVSMSGLTGDIVEHWKQLACNRPTIVFAVNLHHSRVLCEMFNKEGIPAEHCQSETKDSERDEIIARLESGKIKVVCNVGILCTGVDIPSLGAIVMARPTKSLNLFIQQAGRGTRTFENKKNCILLDHAGNILRHGFPTMEPEVDLDGKITEDSFVGKSKICKKCFAVYRGPFCPECGKEQDDEQKLDIETNDGKLVELVAKSKNPVEQYLEILVRQGKGKRKAWVYDKLVEKFGLEMASPYLPDYFIREQKDPFAKSQFSRRF
jgi:DNA repair protein RadD